MFSEIKRNLKNKFYEVKMSDIEDVENEIGIIFPDQLKKFYLEVGYGFIHGSEGNVNRIMDPYSVRDFRLRQNDFEYYTDIEIYGEFENNKLIFFEGNEVSMISIAFDNDKSNSIFYYDEKIADSFIDFINKISKDDTFYYDSY